MAAKKKAAIDLQKEEQSNKSSMTVLELGRLGVERRARELAQKVHSFGASRDRLWLVKGGRTGKTEEVEMFVRIRLNVRTEVGRMTLNE